MNDPKKAVSAPERLIDGNELMDWLKSKIRECVLLNAHAEAATTEEIIRYVKHMPAVDAVPVEWLEEHDSEGNSYGRRYITVVEALSMWQEERGDNKANNTQMQRRP